MNLLDCLFIRYMILIRTHSPEETLSLMVKGSPNATDSSSERGRSGSIGWSTAPNWTLRPHNIRTNALLGSIQNDSTQVHEKPVADKDLVTRVAMERRLNPWVNSNGAKKDLSVAYAVCLLVRGLVIKPGQMACLVPLCNPVRIKSKGHFSGQPLLFFCSASHGFPPSQKSRSVSGETKGWFVKPSQ